LFGYFIIFSFTIIFKLKVVWKNIVQNFESNSGFFSFSIIPYNKFSY